MCAGASNFSIIWTFSLNSRSDLRNFITICIKFSSKSLEKRKTSNSSHSILGRVVWKSFNCSIIFSCLKIRAEKNQGFFSGFFFVFLFRLLLSNCLNWKIYCDDHSSLWSTTAVQIYELFHKYFTSKPSCMCYRPHDASVWIAQFFASWTEISFN